MAFKGDDSTLSLATTVTLALAVAAMVFVKNPLQSSRPPGTGSGPHQATGELKVPARLWEDPFGAVERVLETSKQLSVQVAIEGKNVAVTTGTVGPQLPNIDGLSSLYQKIEEIDEPEEQTLALVVMTQGESSVEASEVRIRDRYAVGAALEVACFAPDKGEWLAYFTWMFPEKSDELVRQYTPYEWYSRNEITTCGKHADPISRVLVLWVKSPESDEKILARLGALLEKVHPSKWEKTKSLRVKLLGPRTSSEFRSVLEEIDSGLSRTPQAQHKWRAADGRVGLYSPWATAPPVLLASGLKDVQGKACNTYHECRSEFERLLTAGGLDSSYRVTSDDVLFESLLMELDRRKVRIGKDRIVLIGEWDSFYARALPPTFTAAACQHVTKYSKDVLEIPCNDLQVGLDNILSSKLSPQDFNIDQYSYLSGLDGETAEDHAKRTKSKEDDKTKDWDKADGKGRFRDMDSYERPEGQAQLDYVRRLVTRIKAECQTKEEEQGKEKQQGKVKAIGILGRDPYDALLILQALREQFPNVLFFATDLDARYFHEDEQKWTRNLIVASQFGLQLAPSLQQSIPPFRSSLQTSAFFAVLQAIGWVPPQGPDGKIPPRLFEIGRHGAVDLSVEDTTEKQKSIHPKRTDVKDDNVHLKLPQRIGLLWIVGLTLGFLMLWGYGRLWNWMTAREELDPTKRRLEVIPRSAWILIPIILILWFVCQIVHLPSYAEDEPFSWSDGVSIWPTEALRFVAICLCLLFLIKARADSVHNIVEISRSFFPELANRPRAKGWRNTLKGFGSDLHWMFHGSKQDRPGEASNIWMRYCRAHGLLPRAGRIALGLTIYVLLLLPLVLVMNDGGFRLSVPCRGTFSCTADAIFVSMSVVSFLVLNLASLDAVILCTKWIQELPAAVTNKPPIWKIRLLVERSKVVNRRILHPFVILFLLIAARSHYFDNWDFPPVLILALTVNSLVAIASATMLYLAAVGAKRRILEPLQQQLDDLVSSAQVGTTDQRARDEALRRVISDIDGVQQGAFVPFYQQPMVQATLVALLAFLQYWYLGQ